MEKIANFSLSSDLASDDENKELIKSKIYTVTDENLLSPTVKFKVLHFFLEIKIFQTNEFYKNVRLYGFNKFLYKIPKKQFELRKLILVILQQQLFGNVHHHDELEWCVLVALLAKAATLLVSSCMKLIISVVAKDAILQILSQKNICKFHFKKQELQKIEKKK